MRGTDRHYEVPATTNKTFQATPASERIAEHTGNTEHLTKEAVPEVFSITDASDVTFSTETFGKAQVQLYATEPSTSTCRVLGWFTPEQAETFAHDLLYIARLARAGKVQAK